MAKNDTFFWYELMTSDPKAAEAFYAKVVGWTPQAWDGPMPYTIMNAGDQGVGGIMALPEEAKANGCASGWVGYVKVADVDGALANVRAAGGKVQREPDDIPNVGRFAVVADPQGATFMLLQPSGPEMPEVPPQTPGHVGWHELYTSDHEKGMAFYEKVFGWVKEEAIDMGPMGKYQLFADARQKDCGAVGGMMNLPPTVPVPVWGFYFVVGPIDEATQRVKEAGGEVFMEPMQVPGGAWIINGRDPQGAYFALVGSKAG